jgi:DNA-binding NtrC family response regulator
MYEISGTVDTEINSTMGIAGIRRLLRAAGALARARQQERERSALWPIEPAVEASRGVFASQAMQEIVATARKAAATDLIVLITGETGTGKEVVARVMHDACPQAKGPFLAFNCSAVPRDMLDSQLFGHRRGAFTGAVNSFEGVIRAAAGGTLFLDEIGELSPEVQPKLLRFLESGEIQPLGEAQPIRCKVRVIAATNADIDQFVAAGRFREDLFYRINGIRLRLPPLRERREEIPVLVQHFLSLVSTERRKDNVRIAEEAMEYLLLYAWPGNVRQLANEVRRLVEMAESHTVLMPEHLSPEIVASRRTIAATPRPLMPSEVVVRLDQPLSAAVEHLERALIPYAMRGAGNRLEVAAKTLGLSRKGLYLKRQRLGLDTRT